MLDIRYTQPQPLTKPRYWPCSKGSRVASPSAISVIGARHEPPSGPRKRACWFSHGPMPPEKKHLLAQVRQGIETSFSQLWHRFLDRVFSRSWRGLWNTVQLKVIHYNLCHAGILSK